MSIKENIVFLLAVVLLSAAVVAGCNTFDADYERDNPRDPEGTNFIQSKPAFFNVEILNGVIDITWDDVSDYNK